MSGRGPEGVQAELAELRALVRDLQERVRLLELDREGVPTRSSGSSWRRVEAPASPEGRDWAQQSNFSESPRLTAESSGRERILRRIGRWISDCLRRQRRGLSGREELRQSSRIYLLFRDYAGRVYNPVEIFPRWGDLAPRVSATGSTSRTPYTGDSVYIGLPSKADAQLVVHEAGVDWPAGQ